ncbi:MAG: hypothetical protein LBN05_02510 [Oscillospiraceae bacterium]|nr:hypothetical protein [Oscillospiraceae bacterium]
MNMKRLPMLALILALLVSVAACGKDAVQTAADPTVPTIAAEDTQPATLPETEAETLAQTQPETQPTEPSATAPQETAPVLTQSATQRTTTTTVPVPTTVHTTAPRPKLPSTKAEILAKYTAILNQAKSEKPAFTKIQYQDLPKDKRHADGAATSLLSSFVDKLFTSEKDARSKPEVYGKGGDMQEFPVSKSAKGCYLTDTKLIKSAALAENNGIQKIRIVLNNQENPAPYWDSQRGNDIGGMFILPRQEDMNDVLKTLPLREPQYNLTYYDCTAELEYDASTGHIISLKLTTHALANASAILFIKRETMDFVVDDYTFITVTY